MGKTKHSKIALKDIRKPYQDNERPKNKPRGAFSKYGFSWAKREDFGIIGHQSNGPWKRIYSKILRRKIEKETEKIIKEEL